MAGQSGLERTNSWKPFIDLIEEAVQAKDFRKAAIKPILHFVDPSLSFWPGSLWRWCLSWLLGSGLERGRRAMYEVPFQRFLQRNRFLFVEAPLVAIQAYNSLVQALLAGETNLLLDEQRARERVTMRERLLRKGKSAQASLMDFLSNYPKEETAFPTATVIVEERIESLLPQDIPIDAKSKRMIESFIARHFDVKKVQERQLCEHAMQFLHTRAVAFNKKNYSFLTAAISAYQHCSDLFSEPFLSSLLHVDEKVISSLLQGYDAFVAAVEEMFVQKEQSSIARIQRARQREDVLKDIQEKVRQFRLLIEPFTGRKDVRAQAEAVLAQLGSIAIPDDIFTQCPTEEIEKEIAETKEELLNAERRVKEEFRQLLIKIRTLGLEADSIWLMILMKRWEIFSGALPYPDLQELASQIRTSAFSSMRNARHEFVVGKTTAAQFAESSLETIYTQDVKLLRGELTARSLRIKDIRMLVEQELIKLDLQIGLLLVAGGDRDLFLAGRDWLKKFHDRLIRPYLSFRESSHPEVVNALFRFYWSDLERFQDGDAERRIAFVKGVVKFSQEDLRPVLRVLDRCERDSSRAGVYQAFLQQSRQLRGEKLATFCAAWMSKNSSQLLDAMLIPLSLCSGEDQERCIHELVALERKLKELVLLANAIRAVKTYEPERITSLLEGLVLLHVPSAPILSTQELFTHIHFVEGVLRNFEEELMIELGSLDKSIRLEKGDAARMMQELARKQLSSFLPLAAKSFNALCNDDDPCISAVASRLFVECSRLQSIEIAESEEVLFSSLRDLAALLFQKRNIEEAKKRNSFARALLILALTHDIVERAYRGLPERRAAEEAALETLSLSWRTTWECLCDGPTDVQRRKSIHDLVQQTRLIGEKSTDNEVKNLWGLLEQEERSLGSRLGEPPHLAFVPGNLAHLLIDTGW